MVVNLIDRRLYPSRALHGQVAHEIGRRIASGALPEGGFLPREAELSGEFSVSRQAVREALKVLAAKGLVTSRRRAGTCVTPRSSWNLLDPDVLAWHPVSRLPPELLRDLVELRHLIEPVAAELAAARGKREQIAVIGAALDAMHRSVGDPEAFNRADAEFHSAIFTASGNTLIDRLSTILRPLLNTSFAVQERTRGDTAETVPRHDAVFKAIIAGDASSARREMETMLSIAATEVEKAIGAAVEPAPKKATP